MTSKVEKILTTWHKYFSDEEKQYSEFEDSDIEYFVGCMLYNYFAFSKALETMKTMDLSYDFLLACGDEYDEIKSIIESLEFDTEVEKLGFLQNYISESRLKYSDDELYLLNRLENHINGMADRYENDIETQKVTFEISTKSRNPLIK
ncbi:MAG: hypothetical protein J7L21_02165 [Sulfurimonas sp.]|nr:hypothetical protein [Sulfurimonas sp.]